MRCQAISKMGDPLLSSTLLGPLHTAAARAVFMEGLKRAEEQASVGAPGCHAVGLILVAISFQHH